MTGASIHRKSRPTSFSSEELEDLRRGSWKIDCPRVVLKSHSTKPRSIFVGPGFIHQTVNRQLTYKIYSNRQRGQSSGPWNDSAQAGDVVPEEAFYDLVATDGRGRKWECDRLLPDHINWTASGKAIVDGNIAELYCNGAYPKNIRFKGNRLQMLVFDSVRFPRADSTKIKRSVAGEPPSSSFTRNAWKFTCLGYNFLLVQEQDDLFKIEIFSKEKKFQPYFSQRVTEALQFVLGRPIEWSVMEERIGSKTHVAVRSLRMDQTDRLFFYPIPPDLMPDSKTNKSTSTYHRRLFQRYFKHVIDYDKPHHLLWAQIDAIYEASRAMFVDALALTLSVAIETLLNSEFPKLGIPALKDIGYIEEVRQYVEKWDGDSTIKKRVTGSISQMRTPRAGDKLYALISLPDTFWSDV